jgi:hypothetical protein
MILVGQRVCRGSLVLWISLIIYNFLGVALANFGGGHPPASGDWVDYCHLGIEGAYCNNITLPKAIWERSRAINGEYGSILTNYYNTFLIKHEFNGSIAYLTVSSSGDPVLSAGPISVQYNNPQKQGDGQLFFMSSDLELFSIINTNTFFSFESKSLDKSKLAGASGSLSNPYTKQLVYYDPSVPAGVRIADKGVISENNAIWTLVPFPPREYKIGSYYIQSKLNCTKTGAPLYLTSANTAGIGRTHLNTSTLIKDKDLECLQLFTIYRDAQNSGQWVGIAPLFAPDFKVDWLNWGWMGDVSIILWTSGWRTYNRQENQLANVEIPLRGEWGQILMYPRKEKYIFAIGSRTEVVLDDLGNIPNIIDSDKWRFIPYPMPPEPELPPKESDSGCPTTWITDA